MKTVEEIMNSLSAAIGASAESVAGADEYNVIVCPERIFNADYVRAERSDEMRHNREGSGDMEDPEDVPYQNTIFIVIKFGAGQINKAVLHLPVTIQCVSEDGGFEIASAILRKFCNDYNFEYTDGIVMSFYTPNVASSTEEMYSGYRTLLVCRGSVKVPEDGVLCVTEVWCAMDDDDDSSKLDWFRIPFLNENDQWNASTDPQSFAGQYGRTMNMNRQSTSNASFDCYLWSYSEEQLDAMGDSEKYVCTMLNRFSKAVLGAKFDMNHKFFIYFKTNLAVCKDDSEWNSDMYSLVKDVSGIAIDTDDDVKSYYLPATAGWFTLANRSHSQQWGDINAYSLAFTEAKHVEE